MRSALLLATALAALPALAASPSPPAAHALLKELGDRGTSHLETNVIRSWAGADCGSTIIAQLGTYSTLTVKLDIDWGRVTEVERRGDREIRLSGAFRRDGRPSALVFIYAESSDLADRAAHAMDYLREQCAPKDEVF